jgi:hypothetical protein
LDWIRIVGFVIDQDKYKALERIGGMGENHIPIKEDVRKNMYKESEQ